MPTRSLTVFSEVSQDFVKKLGEIGASPSGPYVDGRSLSGILKQLTQMVSCEFTPGTTVSEDGTVIAVTDDVEVKCGFTPKLALLLMESGTGSRMYAKMFGMDLAALKDYAWQLRDASTNALTNNAMRFNNMAENDSTVVTILNAITVNARPHKLIVLG